MVKLTATITIVCIIFFFKSSKARPIAHEAEEAAPWCHNEDECPALKFGDAFRSASSKWSLKKKTPSHRELCKFCDITLPIVRYLIAKNDTQHFTEIVAYACEELKLADRQVCEMIVKTYQVMLEDSKIEK